jgi:hypothetical protein
METLKAVLNLNSPLLAALDEFKFASCPNASGAFYQQIYG